MTEFPNDLETLKPLLLKLLNEQIPAAIKEMAEQILNRITAQQDFHRKMGRFRICSLHFQSIWGLLKRT